MATLRRCLRCAQELPPERAHSVTESGSMQGHSHAYCSRRCLLLAAGLPASFDARQPGELALGADRLLATLPAPRETGG